MSTAFAVGDAAALEQLFANQVRCLSPRFDDPVCRGRAMALVGCVTPALVWLRDHKGTALNFEVVRFATDLRWISTVVFKSIVLLRDPATGVCTEVDVGNEIPDRITAPLRSYLSDIGYDPGLPLAQQKRGALDQHSFVALSCLPGFGQQQLGV